MLPYRDSMFSRVALVIFFLVVVAYAYFEARGLLYGPRIEVPTETTLVHEQFVKISGRAERITKLTMNGNPVPVTEDGAFEEPYVLAVGQNRIVLRAEDKYGRTSEQTVQIFYQPLETAAPTPATEATTTSAVY